MCVGCITSKYDNLWLQTDGWQFCQTSFAMASFVSSTWQELQKNIEIAGELQLYPNKENFFLYLANVFVIAVFLPPDPRTKDWLLLWSSPLYVWALTATYILIVFLGPRVMKNRKPFSLQYFLVIYNLGLVALSVYMLVEVSKKITCRVWARNVP